MPCFLHDYLFLNKKDSRTFVFEGKICIISLYRVYLCVIQRIAGIFEGTEFEYKKAQTGLIRSVYESICAFLNRRDTPKEIGLLCVC